MTVAPRIQAVARRHLLAASAGAALGVDAYVHATSGFLYEPNTGGIITEASIFYAEATAAGLVAVLLLLRPTRFSWLIALAVSASALGAVVLYRYVDVGSIGPIPDLYEPSWQVPGKLLSAYAEAIAVALSVAGVGVTRSRTRT